MAVTTSATQGSHFMNVTKRSLLCPCLLASGADSGSASNGNLSVNSESHSYTTLPSPRNEETRHCCCRARDGYKKKNRRVISSLVASLTLLELVV